MDEKVIVYLGPTLDIETAQAILPDGIFRPPIKHADLISDIHIYEPTHVIIIDGEFGQALSVWHKEVVYALQMPTISGVYGAASMGALRAAELADYGMVGIGKIFWWYYEGVLEDDNLVTVFYHQSPDGKYTVDTPAKVDTLARRIFHERKYFSQKTTDAIEALLYFRDRNPLTDRRPLVADLSPLFMGMFERDRMIEVKGTRIPLQNIDSWISTEDWDYAEILWNAQNRALVLVLADLLGITLTQEQINREATRFFARHFRCKPEEFHEVFSKWLKDNGLSPAEFQVLMIQNAKIRRLQHAQCSTMMFRRRTQTVLSHLRTHNQLSNRIESCEEMERLLVDKDNREFISLDPAINLPKLIDEHLKATGMWVDGDLSEYLKETGIGSIQELSVVLQRSKLALEIANDDAASSTGPKRE